MVKLTLDQYLDERGITRYELSKRSEIDYKTLNKYYHNRVRRYDSHVLDRICAALNCQISDLIQFID